jgi:hypothetical protein
MNPQGVQLNGSSVGSISTPFNNQGQVDWVAFGNTVYSASLAVMQRLSNAGIQPITHGAALALGSQYRIGDVGLRRVEEMLQKLPRKQIVNKLLEVGFGIRHIIYTLADSQHGLNIVALCSCLTAWHTEIYSARVLEALWKIRGFPDEYKPAPKQFVRLIEACAGSITTSTFLETIDIMLPSEFIDSSKDPRLIPTGSSAEKLAEALNGLFLISKGEVQQIQVTGGVECGFFAAFAVWLFNFQVVVKGKTNDLIFTCTPEGSIPQVIVNCDDSGDRPSQEIQLRSRTYSLSSTKIFSPDAPTGSERNYSYPSIQVPWNRCLKTCLKPIYERAMKQSKLLGRVLGSLGAIYNVFDEHERFSIFGMEDFIQSNPSRTLGPTWTETMLFTFPELKNECDLIDSMIKAEMISASQAIEIFQMTLHELAEVCQCKLCENGHGGENIRWKYFARTSQCLVGFVFLIHGITIIKPWIVSDTKLRPTIHGIHYLYYLSRIEWTDCRDDFFKWNQPNSPDLHIRRMIGCVRKHDPLREPAVMEVPVMEVPVILGNRCLECCLTKLQKREGFRRFSNQIQRVPHVIFHIHR